MIGTDMTADGVGVFRLVGARDYVQGSQMLAEAARRLAPCTSSFPPTLSHCAFRRLSGREPIVSMVEPGMALPSHAIGEATFVHDLDARRFAFLETAAVPIRVPEEARWTLAASGEGMGRLQGSFAFKGASDFEALLEIVIRALKGLHAVLAPDVRDIWFTGCRDADLAAPTTATGRVDIAPLRLLTRGPIHQTFSRVDITFDDGRRQQGAISFAFRSEEFADAD